MMAGLQKRKIRWTIFSLIAVYLLSIPATAKYNGGTGKPNDPYQIATVEDLILLGDSPEDYDKHFILIADIDLDPNLPGRKVFDRAIIGSSPYILFAGVFDDEAVIAPDVNDLTLRFKVGSLTGVFDGNGHVISNLNIQHSGQVLSILQPINFGLFGQLHSEAEVRNLGVADVNINVRGDDYYKVGGIVGRNNGNVIQCYSTGSVIGGEFVGGLAGYNNGDVAVCYSGCAVTGIRMIPDQIVWPGLPVWPEARSVEGGVGGLVGYNTGSIAMSCSTGSVRGSEGVGGMVGYNTGSIAMSCSTGSVRGSEIVGGMVGYNTGSIDMSYSTGAVSGNDCVGGLVGTNGSYSIPKPMKPILVPIEPNLPIGPKFPVDPNFFVDPNIIIDPGFDPGFITGPIFPVDPNFFFLVSGSIKNCYATGSVTGAKRFGGLVGENKFGEVVTSFWDIETSG